MSSICRMTLKGVVLYALLGLLWISCGSKEKIERVERQTALMPCIRTEMAPKVDGRLGDHGWERVAPFSGFILANGSAQAKEQTKGYIAYDDTCLYVGAVCQDSKGEYATANTIQRDTISIREDDAIEIFLDTNRDHATYIHVIVNALGTQYDQKDGQDPASWDGKWRAEATATPQWWQMECAFPFKELGVTPQEGDLWGFNMARVRWPGPEYSNWSCTYGAVDDPERWGDIVFVPTSAMVELSTIGDTYGDLYRSSILQMKLSSNMTRGREVIARVDVFHGDEWTYGNSETLMLPPQTRRVISRLHYTVAHLEENVLAFTLSDKESGTVYYRSPAYPLQSTFFGPRVDVVKDKLLQLRENREARDKAKAYEKRLEDIASQLQVAGRPSRSKWDEVDEQLRNLERELGIGD